eukprot:2705635-Rhodomonas_salina.1
MQTASDSIETLKKGPLAHEKALTDSTRHRRAEQRREPGVYGLRSRAHTKAQGREGLPSGVQGQGLRPMVERLWGLESWVFKSRLPGSRFRG